jgi:hypothetical protein
MRKPKRSAPASLDEIIDELTAEAGTDDERIWNFQQAFEKHVSLPCDGSVIGEPVTVFEFHYDGNQRRAVTPPGGLTRSGRCFPMWRPERVWPSGLANRGPTRPRCIAGCVFIAGRVVSRRSCRPRPAREREAGGLRRMWK